MLVKFVSEMCRQACDLNRCHVLEVKRIVASSQPHQKAVLHNKYAAVRCMYMRASLHATCMS